MVRVIKKFAGILNHRQKIQVLLLGILMVIGGMLEMMGVTLIVPLLTAVIDPDFMDKPYVKKAAGLFGLQSYYGVMMLILGLLVFIYIFKNAFLFMEYYLQFRFVCNNRFLVQRQMLRVYMYRPYEFYLNATTGEIMRIINTDVINAFGLLTTVLNFCTEVVVSAALISIIFVIDPGMAGLIGLILGVVMLLMYKGVKPVLRGASQKFMKNSSMANKWLLQSINGIKDVKVNHKEEYFIEEYAVYGRQAIDAEKINSVVTAMPRLLIEAVSISAVLIVIMILLTAGQSLDALVPQLGAFAVAAVRLLPSTTRISGALNAIAFQEPMLDNMIRNLNAAKEWEQDGQLASVTENEKSNKKLTFEKQFELSHIHFHYPNNDREVLSDAQMSIPVGKSIGVVGTSGSGKTTAIDLLLGLLKPQAGQVLTDGVDIHENYYEWLEHLSYIPQTIYMLDDTIRANVAFGCHKDEIDDDMVWKAIEEAQLKEFVESLPAGIETKIGERGVRLSGGQRQRIGIARALYTDPELVIFDEATSALDNETEAAIMESINSLHGKKTLVIIAHRLSTIEECDMIFRVEDGRIELQR